MKFENIPGYGVIFVQRVTYMNRQRVHANYVPYCKGTGFLYDNTKGNGYVRGAGNYYFNSGAKNSEFSTLSSEFWAWYPYKLLS